MYAFAPSWRLWTPRQRASREKWNGTKHSAFRSAELSLSCNAAALLSKGRWKISRRRVTGHAVSFLRKHHTFVPSGEEARGTGSQLLQQQFNPNWWNT